VRREDFTIVSAPGRFAAVGDLWAPVHKPSTLDLDKVERYARKHGMG